MSKQPSPQTMQCLGSTVHYWEFNKGKKQTIVMLHGFRGTHHGLLQIIAQLPQFHIIVPDLPGFGVSTPMTERKHDITGYGDFATAFIKAVAPAKPILLGHSFGTIIAAKMAAETPKLIDKLILVNPVADVNTNRFKPSLEFGRLYYWFANTVLPEKIALKLLRSKPLILFASFMMTKTKNKALRKAVHKHHLDHFGDFHTKEALVEAYDASLMHAVGEHATKISMPTLLIAGELDIITPPKGQYLLEKRIPNAKLVMVPGVGHLVHYETPAVAARAIQEFLNAF